MQKTASHLRLTKGMTPIEKNIIVIDELGNQLEATYPKRARGLVKKGRARFIDENTICLACPPNALEDTVMANEQIHKNTSDETIPGTACKYNIDYVLEQLEKLAVQAEYVINVISELRQMNTGVAGDVAGMAKAEALSTVVQCRETTNQQLIRFYEKMYDDLKPNAIHNPAE